MSNASSVIVQDCLDRLRNGDQAAHERLFEVASDRLRRLANSMISGAERVQRWEQADDVLQNTLLRLHKSLEEVRPATVREFFQFATLQFRRELIDLARHYYGALGIGANHASTPASTGSTDGGEPPGRPVAHDSSNSDEFSMWTELHEQIKKLPEEERETFELLWYHGLTQDEVASVLDVSTRTVQRRWFAACEQLRSASGGAFASR